MFNGELYAQRFQKLIYLYLFTDYFMKISLQSGTNTGADDSGARLIIKVKGNQYRWLAGGYDPEIGHL